MISLNLYRNAVSCLWKVTSEIKLCRVSAFGSSSCFETKTMMCVCVKVSAKLTSVEEECESLRRSLSVEVDGRRELEGGFTILCYCVLLFIICYVIISAKSESVDSSHWFSQHCIYATVLNMPSDVQHNKDNSA